MMDIASRLNTTHATVNYWMKKHGLDRRAYSDSTYCKLNPKGDPFNIKKRLSGREKDLLLTGLMLYWAEGSKSAKGSTQLANLDPRMLQLFVEFLRKICRVHEERLRLYVRVYKDFSKEKAKKYWVKKLKISPSRILTYTHTDKRSKEHKQWSQYGIATLQYHNLKLWEWLNNSIEEHLTKTISD